MGAMASQITSLTIVYSTVYSDADQRKHQSSASLAFVRGIHRGPVNSPHKWPVMRKMFPFHDVIMIGLGDKLSTKYNQTQGCHIWALYIQCYWTQKNQYMMKPPNGTIFCVTGPLWGESTGHRWIPLKGQWLDVFFDLRLNKRLSKQSRRRGFAMPLRSLWRHCNDFSLHTQTEIETINRNFKSGFLGQSYYHISLPIKYGQ